MTGPEFFIVLAAQYPDKPDHHVLSIGDHRKPHPDQPVSITNLPHFSAKLSITLREVRAWAEGKDAAE